MKNTRNAFTMIEVIFVITIIGILSAIAIPKFAMTRNDALMTKGISTLATVRSAVAAERQKRILRGDFTAITKLNGDGDAFSTFDDANGSRILEYNVENGTKMGDWSTSDGITYTFKSTNGDCTFKLDNNRFVDETSGGCEDLE
jgi:general secretion pathway protein G